MRCARHGKQGSETRCGLVVIRISSLSTMNRSLTAFIRKGWFHLQSRIRTSCIYEIHTQSISRVTGYVSAC